MIWQPNEHLPLRLQAGGARPDPLGPFGARSTALVVGREDAGSPALASA
jgi:hypothetical protein